MKTKLICLALLALLSFAVQPVRAQSCSNATAAISLPEGSISTIHVTVVDQNCNPLDPSKVALLDQGGCPTSAVATSGATELSYATDATGFNFSVVAGASAMAPCQETWQYTDGTVTQKTTMTFAVTSPVTGISTTSP